MRGYLTVISLILALPGCQRQEPAPVAPTPTPIPVAQVDRAIRERIAPQEHALEQALANRRASAEGARLSIDLQRRLQAEIDQRNGAATSSPAR